MKKLTMVGVVLLMSALVFVFGCERRVVNEVTENIVQPADAQYIGSQFCDGGECHGTIYETFRRTGHPFKVNKVEDVLAGNYYPYTNFPGAPPDYSMSDFTYVIGGYWWKTRFMDNNGYVLTGDEVQYNFETSEWVGYETDKAPGTKPFDCGACHTTGFSTEGHQDDLEGIEGTWAFPGIQCEECHGPGEFHALNPRGVVMTIDRSAEACGKCHIRGSVSSIPASGGFIRHHEQWNEIFTTKHISLDCVDCHDPHLGLHPSNPDREAAITNKCENCHFEELQSFEASDIPHSLRQVECIDCHMPYAAKSAVGDTSRHRGDIRSHLMRINTDPEAELTSGSTANGYLSLDFSCLSIGCHLGLSKEFVAEHAHDVHKDLHAEDGE